MLLNLVGVGLGVTFAGVAIDVLIAQGIEEPYTKALLGFTIISFLAIPAFFFAGRRYERDRQALTVSQAVE